MNVHNLLAARAGITFGLVFITEFLWTHQNLWWAYYSLFENALCLREPISSVKNHFLSQTDQKNSIGHKTSVLAQKLILGFQSSENYYATYDVASLTFAHKEVLKSF